MSTAFLQPGDDEVVVIAANGAGFVGPREWNPDLGPTREPKRFRHDADDGIGFTIQKNVAANDAAVGSKMIAPEIEPSTTT